MSAFSQFGVAVRQDGALTIACREQIDQVFLRRLNQPSEPGYFGFGTVRTNRSKPYRNQYANRHDGRTGCIDDQQRYSAAFTHIYHSQTTSNRK